MVEIKEPKGYLEADEFVTYHEDDPDLKPMVFRLPTPPSKSTISGYGKCIEDQRFERVTIPPRLIHLEKEALRLLVEQADKSKNFTVTMYKIQRKFWEMLEKNSNKYKSEIAFIDRMWWHRINGYWFYNRGKPTYITGWHFMYLNFWHMSDVLPHFRPDYRDRDRKEFLFFDYTYKTKETFYKIDENGYGVPNKDGTYRMKKLDRRVSFGGIQNKNRRSGNTNKGLCSCDEVATRTLGMDVGLGIMSFTKDSAKGLFQQKLVEAFFKKPLFFMPFTTSARGAKEEINLDVTNTEWEYEGLSTIMDFAKTSHSKYYDSKKMASAFCDEEGKTTETPVDERWRVIQQCLAQGNGALIHGYSYHPSTAEELTSGGAAFKQMIEASDIYRRLPNGQTYSGLMRIFMPADEGLDDYIDSYGYSVKGEIKDYQKKEGFKETSTQYLIGKREAYLRSDEMDSYRSEKKLYPLKYADSWIGDSGTIGFDIEKIDQRIAMLNRHKQDVRGNFEWTNGFGSEVVWNPDPINGKFQISMNIPEPARNKKKPVMMYSTFENRVIQMWGPAFSTMFVLGADPFKFSNKQEAAARKKKIGSANRRSDGGIAIYYKYDGKVDGDKESMDEWVSDKFILSYRYRPRNSDEYNEDVLKAAIYYGAMVYPEINVDNTWEYFIKNKYGGYLLYDVDPITGKQKQKPGIHTGDKTGLFTELTNYIDRRGLNEDFSEFLTECKEIGGPEEMTIYDRLAAHGIALVGANSVYAQRFDDVGNDEVSDISNLLDAFGEGWGF